MLQLHNYSEKSVAISGDTKPHKDFFKSLNGKFNPHLRVGAGWIFSKKRQDDLKTFIESHSPPAKVEKTETAKKTKAKKRTGAAKAAQKPVKKKTYSLNAYSLGYADGWKRFIQLLKALKLNRKAFLSVIEKTICFDGENVTATDLDVFLSAPLKTDFSGVVEWTILEPLLKSTDKIDFFREENTIYAKVGNVKMPMPVICEKNDFPNEKGIGTEQGYEFKKPFDVLLPDELSTYYDYCGKDDLRPAMMGCYISHSGFCATNGHILKYGGELKREEQHFIISAQVLKALTKIGEWKLKAEKNTVGILERDGLKITFKGINETYPNYVGVWPSGINCVTEFAAADMLNVTSLCKPFLTDIGKSVELDINLESITVKAPDPINKGKFLFEQTIPAKSTAEMRTAFNPELMKTVFENDATIKMQLVAKNYGAIVNDNRLLMPVMLHEDRK